MSDDVIKARVEEVRSETVIVRPLKGMWKASVFTLPKHPNLELKKGHFVNIIVPTGGQFVEWAPVE